MPQRPAAVVPLHGHRPAPTRTIAGAVDAFLTQADLADATRREYGKHLSRLATRLGADRPLATITAAQLEAAITDLWGATKPRTWNQRLAVVGSFLAFARRRGWPMAPTSDLTLNLDRRRVKVDRTRVPTPTELERFWAKQNVPLVVKVFTRLQYETAARATELLSADIADLDMDNRRLRVTSKGGDVEWVYFQSGSARNLPRLLRGRTSGPSHLGAKGYGDAALQTKSRHKSRRSLEPYVNVPDELAAKITAETDPHRRRR
jgi:integrase